MDKILKFLVKTNNPTTTARFLELVHELKKVLKQLKCWNADTRRLHKRLTSRDVERKEQIRSAEDISNVLRPVNLDRLLGFLEKNADRARCFEGKDIAILLGTAGVGKSSLVNFVGGVQFREVVGPNGDSVMTPLDPEAIPPLLRSFETSSRATAVTKTINALTLIWDGDKSLLICDTPGLNDEEGPETDIANSVGIIRAIQTARSVRPILLLSRLDFPNRAAAGMDNLARLMSKMMTLEGNIQSFSYVFTRGWLVARGDERRFFRTFFECANQDRRNVSTVTMSLLDDVLTKLGPSEHANMIWADGDDDQRVAILESIASRKPVENPREVFRTFTSMSSLEAVSDGLKRFNRAIMLCLADRFVHWPLAAAPALLDTLGRVGALMQSDDVHAAVEGATEKVRVMLRASLERVKQAFAGVLVHSVSPTAPFSRDGVGRALQPVLAAAHRIFLFLRVAPLLRGDSGVAGGRSPKPSGDGRSSSRANSSSDDESAGGGGGSSRGGSISGGGSYHLHSAAHEDFFFGVYTCTKFAVDSLQGTIDRQMAFWEDNASAVDRQRAILCATSAYAFAVGIALKLYPELVKHGVAVADAASLVDAVEACGAQLLVAFDTSKATVLREVASQTSGDALLRAIGDVYSFATFLQTANDGEYDGAVVADAAAAGVQTTPRNKPASAADSSNRRSRGSSIKAQRLSSRRRRRNRRRADDGAASSDSLSDWSSDEVYLTDDEEADEARAADNYNGDRSHAGNNEAAAGNGGESSSDEDIADTEAVVSQKPPSINGPDCATMAKATDELLTAVAVQLRKQQADTATALAAAYNTNRPAATAAFDTACVELKHQFTWLGSVAAAMDQARLPIADLTPAAVAALQSSLLDTATAVLITLPGRLLEATVKSQSGDADGFDPDLMATVYYGAVVLDDAIRSSVAVDVGGGGGGNGVGGGGVGGGGGAHACAHVLGEFIGTLAESTTRSMAWLDKGASTCYYAQEAYDRMSENLLRLLLTVKAIEVRVCVRACVHSFARVCVLARQVSRDERRGLCCSSWRLCRGTHWYSVGALAVVVQSDT
jgi:uncharacterized membrane protein YgcG